jgi:hypothetical protein
MTWSAGLPVSGLTMSERAKMDVTETPASHAVFVSRPDVVAQLIKRAASAAS